jgi:FlaA1/EpsC-like NDP-sugar epimerase
MKQSPRLKVCLHPVFRLMLRMRNRHFLIADLLLLSLTPLLALLLRLDGQPRLEYYGPALVSYTLAALFIRLAIFLRFGLYRRCWNYATVGEVVQIGSAVLISGLILSALLFTEGFLGWSQFSLPRSIAFVDSLLVLLGVAALRFGARFSRERTRAQKGSAPSPVLVIGAGEAGQRVVRELLTNQQAGMEPLGFIDDDPDKIGLEILGIPVLGPRRLLPELASSTGAKQVIIAMPQAPGTVIRETVNLCEQARVAARTLPPLYSLLDGTANVNLLREVEIEDLLRREPIRTDTAAVAELIHGKTILVTGAGGSIGSELCRQIIRCSPRQLILLGHGENSIFAIQNELLRKLAAVAEAEDPAGAAPAPVISAVIADIRIADRIHYLVQTLRPQVIFHAAAHKHVPLMEQNPVEAVSNNVFGTKNLLDAALAAGVERFVMVSTDKAVNPTSVMGATKRTAELLVLRAARQSGRPYVAVRFGNVLGSRGSVVLTFKKQIADGGPVTVCHPDMKRYFMTIPEAVQLVLQSSVLGRGGEVFVLDMGEPVRIVDLARDLVELSGLHVGRDIDITYTGVRPGEKLFEELFLPGEAYEPTRHGKVLIARNASAFVPFVLNDVLDSLSKAVSVGDGEAVYEHLRGLIPEFRPPERRSGEPVGLPALASARPEAHLTPRPRPAP